MLRAQGLGPPLWVRTRVFTQRSRRSSVLFRQASKHAEGRLSNCPPAETCLCHQRFECSLLNLLQDVNETIKTVFFLHKLTGVFRADVHMTDRALL